MSLVSQIAALATRIAIEIKGKVNSNDSRLSDARTPTDNSVTYAKVAAEYKGRIAMPALNVDWAAGQVFTKTITANSTITFSNLRIGVKDLEITGNYTLGLPGYVEIMDGEYDGTVLNLIQVIITNANPLSEKGYAYIYNSQV